MPGKKINLIGKIRDYTIFGGGVGTLVDGAVRITNNPPEHVLNWNNLNNSQLQFGYIAVILGGAAVAYGIERIVKYSKE